jgi:hypothetical protein
VHSVLGKINYGGLKHNSLYLGLVLVGDRASLFFICLTVAAKHFQTTPSRFDRGSTTRATPPSSTCCQCWTRSASFPTSGPSCRGTARPTESGQYHPDRRPRPIISGSVQLLCSERSRPDPSRKKSGVVSRNGVHLKTKCVFKN